jgi:hypothetical protein
MMGILKKKLPTDKQQATEKEGGEAEPITSELA